MDLLVGITSVAIAFFIVAVSPGPANIAAATVAMRFGRTKGFLFAFGLACGLSFWGLVAATGLGAVLQTSVTLLIGMKIVGGLYLLWLAIQSMRSAVTKDKPEQSRVDDANWFRRGLFLNLSNPKAVVAWMAALSMGLQSGSSTGFVAAATFLCMAIGFANYFLHAFLFSLPGIMNRYKRYRRSIEAATAGLFALAGFGILRSALSR